MEELQVDQLAETGIDVGLVGNKIRMLETK